MPNVSLEKFVTYVRAYIRIDSYSEVPLVALAKNDFLDTLIVLARDETFSFFPLKMIQRGDHWMFVLQFLSTKTFTVKKMFDKKFWVKIILV